jgi:hypothetical protein
MIRRTVPGVLSITVLAAPAADQTTLDAALYDFNCASLRDALLTAHARGV